jgi:pimeloyl-ACP methyl ester carboxylesterase
MITRFATSADGTRIAYDVTGAGEALILLHGGGQNRRSWHEIGYVERLKSDFKVITIDIRGNGESDKPTDATAYTTNKMSEDILAVADTCGVGQFSIWGFSYGGNIGRYLAAESDRVSRMIIMGIPFGLGASGDFRGFIEGFSQKWTPILKSQREGTLDRDSLSKEDLAQLDSGRIPLNLAWLGAILDWRSIVPADLRCPTLWLIGSKNEGAMASFAEYESALTNSKVEAKIIEGFDHRQELFEIATVLPVMVGFMKQ